MLPIVVVLCVAFTQVFGAALVHTDHAVSSNVDASGSASSSHADGSGSTKAYSKDVVYAYDKGSASGSSDVSSSVALNNAHAASPYYHYPAYAGYGAPYGYAPYAPAHAAHGANTADYNQAAHQEYAVSYDRGSGSSSERSFSTDYAYNRDAAAQNGAYSAAQSNAYNNQHNYAPYYAPYYYATPYAYGHSAHSVHKRHVPAVYNAAYYKYPSYAYNGYPYAYGYHGYPYGYPNAYYGYGYGYAKAH